jgi:hypothetical protein
VVPFALVRPLADLSSFSKDKMRSICLVSSCVSSSLREASSCVACVHGRVTASASVAGAIGGPCKPGTASACHAAGCAHVFILVALSCAPWPVGAAGGRV